MVLDRYGSEGSWFEILPSNRLRQEGEPIRYTDTFNLISNMDESKYYLHMATSEIYKASVSCELNASDIISFWQARRYMEYS